MWDPYAEFQSATLPNGLEIHAAHWPGRPWEAMGFLVHSGAEQDPVGLEGLAHFVEHLVSCNADLSKKQIMDFFHDHGGRVDLGETGYFATRYRFFAPTDKATLISALKIFGQMLIAAELKNRIEEERQVVIGEFNRIFPVKFRLELWRRKMKMLFAGEWLERFVRPIGALESIARIAPDDIRRYYDSHYTPANISIVGVGGLTPTELVELISESPLAAIKNGARTPLPAPASDTRVPLETRHVLEVSKHAVMAEPVAVGAYRSATKIPGTVNWQAIRILRTMLSELLIEEAREKRAWTYDIGVDWGNLRRYYEFFISCDALSIHAIDEVEGLVEACIASIRDRDEFFERTKRQLLAELPMIDSSAKKLRDNSLDDLAAYHRIITLAECARDIERVTMDDVRDLLNWLRPERRWTLIERP